MSGPTLRSAGFHRDVARARLALVVSAVCFVLAACGEDDGEGGAPDLFLGLSGFVIACLVVWFIARAIRRRG